MVNPVRFEITAAFETGDLVAEVELDSGEKSSIVLRSGVFEGSLPGRAKRLRLTLDSAPGGPAPEPPPQPASPPPAARPVAIEALFGEGVEVPEDGRLTLEALWALPCAAQPPAQDLLEPTLYNAQEHFLTAEWVGQKQNGKPLSFNGMTTTLTKDTQLFVGNSALRFGEIIALAADYYAFLDAKAAATPAITAAWPAIPGALGGIAGDYRKITLAGDSREAVEHLLRSLTKKEDVVSTAIETIFHDYPLRRYGALASQNFCHFGSQSWDGSIDDGRNDALQQYRHYHARALAEAAAAGPGKDGNALLQAMVVDAFACHFLTDLFASGHLRVPRRELRRELDIVQGGVAAGIAHNEDNAGLWVRMRKNPPGSERVVWRAFGDGYLLTRAAAQHLAMAREAVRRSVEEVFAAFAGAEPSARAEDLLPVPLPSGQGPVAGDIPPDASILGTVHSAGQWPPGVPEVNRYPLYTLSRTGVLGKRQGSGPGYAIVRGAGEFIAASGS